MGIVTLAAIGCRRFVHGPLCPYLTDFRMTAKAQSRLPLFQGIRVWTAMAVVAGKTAAPGKWRVYGTVFHVYIFQGGMAAKAEIGAILTQQS